MIIVYKVCMKTHIEHGADSQDWCFDREDGDKPSKFAKKSVMDETKQDDYSLPVGCTKSW